MADKPLHEEIKELFHSFILYFPVRVHKIQIEFHQALLEFAVQGHMCRYVGIMDALQISLLVSEVGLGIVYELGDQAGQLLGLVMEQAVVQQVICFLRQLKEPRVFLVNMGDSYLVFWFHFVHGSIFLS